MKLLFITLLAACQQQVAADMYLQFPGGGNNRLNENGRERRNKNRLFDSQNNNRFGHNQHGHYFYTDSEIDMQWTVQHSCGPDSNLNCEVVLQYACEDDLRDGQTTDTIPKRNEDCKNNDCNNDYHYGMHENLQYYQHCSLRERNKGLFPADRHINGGTARYTRQENHGQRYGYECNEERDHYPYWHPTIWKDIAVFTDEPERCEYYQAESENVKGRWHCHVSDEFLAENYNPDTKEAIIPIDKEGCEELGAEWKQSDPHTYPNGDAIPPPVCEAAPYQRDNHHGNGDDGYMVGHKWTVPEQLVHSNCAIRIRYNISSTDYDAWNIGYDDKVLNERLDDRASTHVGKCYGFDEGPAKITGYWVDELDIDMDTALEIKPRNDERIKLTRESADSDIWTVTTKSWGWQWFGWGSNDFGYKKVKVSFDVNFAVKPEPGQGHYGMKFFGNLVNDWVDEAVVGEWKHVELEYDLPLWGDGQNILMIFDSVSVNFQLKNFELCTIDQLADGNPFSSFQDDMGWDAYEAKQRGYEHRNDARLKIFDDIDMKLRSAYNTDQLGRVFEDRSHKIKFVQLPEDIKQDITTNNKKVYNLNARGKIGNNVEVYPAFEYDFAPSRLVAQEGDYLHIQWSGSNTNNYHNDHSQTEANGNTVESLRGKDRHNMVAIDSMGAIRPTADLEKLSSLLGLDAVDSMSLAFSGIQGGDNEYLQSAGAYFDLGVKKLTTTGKHMFMSAINNAHGVRTQKGKIIVEES